MLDVKIENILPITQVKNDLEKLVERVNNSDELIVVAADGGPKAILIGIHNLETLTGMSHEELMPEEATDQPGDEDNQTAKEEAPAPVDYNKLRDQVLQEAAELPPEDEDSLAADNAVATEAQKESVATENMPEDQNSSATSQPAEADVNKTNPQFSYSPSSTPANDQPLATPTDVNQASMPTDGNVDGANDELTIDASPTNPLMPPTSTNNDTPETKAEAPLVTPMATSNGSTAAPFDSTPLATTTPTQPTNTTSQSATPQNTQNQPTNPPVIYQ